MAMVSVIEGDEWATNLASLGTVAEPGENPKESNVDEAALEDLKTTLIVCVARVTLPRTSCSSTSKTWGTSAETCSCDGLPALSFLCALSKRAVAVSWGVIVSSWTAGGLPDS